ncbi:hypothetical protein [Paraburkholderia flava]|uniref:hypothetical protein n=1 Tax=Paraburkholderia flava TaxID=2547393 RepID=UPI0010617731|nr:hypothetical protein [Paraburkholderia flava]
MLNELRRLVAWFTRPKAKVARAAPPLPAFAFDPVWHGDHWQNLLSSPMDARHYVMEDWALSSALDPFATAGSQNG